MIFYGMLWFGVYIYVYGMSFWFDLCEFRGYV